jgi:hypothetical protein
MTQPVLARAQNTRSSGNPVHGRAPDDVAARAGGQDGEEGTPEGGAVVVARLVGGVEYGRPLATGWSGTLGVNWARARCMDEHGGTITQVRLRARCLFGRTPEIPACQEAKPHPSFQLQSLLFLALSVGYPLK